MNYCSIKWNDVANGTGVRVSLFVSGCPHHCPHCFNPETWDYQAGVPFTSDIEDSILNTLQKNYITGLSLLGGEPLAPNNQEAIINFLKRVRHTCPDKNIWCYTGYYFEDLLLGMVGDFSREILDDIHILVDGPYEEEKKNLGLVFRGSENQRLIDVKTSLAQGSTVTISDEDIRYFSQSF